MATELKSIVRQFYDGECEEFANDQINKELYASYCLTSMWAFFSRDVAAMPGIVAMACYKAKFHRKRASRIMAYQVLRGAAVNLKPIDKPVKQQWSSAKEAFEDCLEMGKILNENLRKWHDCAMKHNDGHLQTFVEEKLMDELAVLLKAVADCYSNLNMVGEGLGTWIFDRWLHKMCTKAKAAKPPTTVTKGIQDFMPNPLFEPMP